MSYIYLDLEMSNLDADFGQVLCGVIKAENGKAKVFRFDEQRKYDPVKRPQYMDAELVVAIRDEIESHDGDIVVTWNGKKFDLPFLDARLLAAGERRLHRPLHHDALYSSRFGLKLSSNRLDTVGRFLDVPVQKTLIEGRYWIPALRGHRPSMDYIVQHCILDVEVLQQVHVRLKGLTGMIMR